MGWTRHEKRVQRTRFPCIQNEFLNLFSQRTCSDAANDLIKCKRSQRSSALDTIWSSKPMGAEFMENEFNGLIFHTWRTSSMNSFSIHGNWVHWTRFLCMKTEFFELDFCVLFHVSSLVNRVQRTWIVINEISFKPCLTYNIVWVLWLFFLKSLPMCIGNPALIVSMNDININILVAWDVYKAVIY